MKKKLSKVLAFALAAACILPLSAKEIKRSVKPAKGWVLYLPGKNNSKDVMKDLNKSGWQVSNSYREHFSLVDSNINGKKCLKFNTLDGKQDAIMLPLTGKEKKVTLIFKAKGAVDPDAAGTPYGIFYAYVQKGSWQTLLRHNSSNQVKGANNMSRLRAPEGPGDIVSDWHDYRLVFDVADPQNMTSECYIDGVLRHKDTCKERTDFAKNPSDPKLSTDVFNWDMMLGQGNYLEFGDNDGSTNAFGRYAYFLAVIDDDVSAMTLEELGAKVKADLVTNPETKNDPDPESKRPASKPAGINIQGPEVNSKDPVFYDTSSVKGKIKLNKLPYSRANAEVVTETCTVPDVKFAATVDPKGTDGAYKTIAEAIEAVPENSNIKIMPGFYYEKLVITKKGIGLIGTNPATTVIYGYEADTGNINGNLLVEVNYLPKGGDAVGDKVSIPEKPEANCWFNAANITFYNKGAEWNKLWGSSEKRSITLALKGVDKCYLKNCVFIGQQDTLYWRSGRIYAENCYIEGDVDFVCGGATALFDNCKIYAIEQYNGGIIVAAAAADTGYSSTAAFAKGYVFRNCKISGAPSYTQAQKKVTMGRGTWTGGSATSETTVGKTVYINCNFDKVINAKPWANWDSVNTAEKCFFREYKSTGDGASKENRPQLTDAEYKAYSTTEAILGFKPAF